MRQFLEAVLVFQIARSKYTPLYTHLYVGPKSSPERRMKKWIALILIFLITLVYQLEVFRQGKPPLM